MSGSFRIKSLSGLFVGFLCALAGCQSQSSAPAPTASAQPAGPVIRIKAGRDTPYTDPVGNVWQPDQGFSGGDTIDRDADLQIANTSDSALYRTEHYGMDAFSCKVPNGKYLVKMYFAETFDGISGPGDRVFSFNVQGQHAFNNFDVYAKTGGPNRADVESCEADVTNGELTITFTTQVENPEINAIEIIPEQ